MKKFQKLLALLLVAAMTVTMLSACGNSEKADTSANTDAETEADSEDEEMAEINVMILSLGAMGEGKTEVENQINAITEKEINTHVTLNYVEVGSYSEQLNLAITGNEKVDLCMTTPIPGSNFVTLTANNQLLPLNDLLDEYGKEMQDVVGELVKGTTVKGNIYAVPAYRNLVSSTYIIARKDLLESTQQLDAFNNMKTWTEYENIMKAVTANNDIAGISNTDAQGTVISVLQSFLDAENIADASSYDGLGDGYKLIACDEDGKVFNYFESDEYKAMIERVNNWYEEGLVYKDAATSDQTGDELMKSNVSFSFVGMAEIGVESSKKGATGYDVAVQKLNTAPITTNSCTKFDWAVPVSATEKEAAVKFLNLMYTNKDIANLLAWGVEGRDYVVKDGVAAFPEGVTRDNVQYHTADFLYGSQFLVYPWEGSPATLREEAAAEMKDGGVSPYLGFSCDTTVISNELAAISNVISEYAPTLESGTTIEYYDDFIKSLKDAGADKVIAEYQTQLDAWLVEQK